MNTHQLVRCMAGLMIVLSSCGVSSESGIEKDAGSFDDAQMRDSDDALGTDLGEVGTTEENYYCDEYGREELGEPDVAPGAPFEFDTEKLYRTTGEDVDYFGLIRERKGRSSSTNFYWPDGAYTRHSYTLYLDEGADLNFTVESTFPVTDEQLAEFEIRSHVGFILDGEPVKANIRHQMAGDELETSGETTGKTALATPANAQYHYIQVEIPASEFDRGPGMYHLGFLWNRLPGYPDPVGLNISNSMTIYYGGFDVPQHPCFETVNRDTAQEIEFSDIDRMVHDAYIEQGSPFLFEIFPPDYVTPDLAHRSERITIPHDMEQFDLRILGFHSTYETDRLNGLTPVARAIFVNSELAAPTRYLGMRGGTSMAMLFREDLVVDLPPDKLIDVTVANFAAPYRHRVEPLSGEIRFDDVPLTSNAVVPSVRFIREDPPQ